MTRKLIIALSAVGFTMSVPLAAAVKAEDTTVIRRDSGDSSSKTVIKKEESFGSKAELDAKPGINASFTIIFYEAVRGDVPLAGMKMPRRFGHRS